MAVLTKKHYFRFSPKTESKFFWLDDHSDAHQGHVLGGPQKRFWRLLEYRSNRLQRLHIEPKFGSTYVWGSHVEPNPWM